MNFASFPYLLFLVTVACIYFCMSKKYRHIFLLFSSYLFYSFFGFGFLALMIVTTIITFITSYYCYYSDKAINKKLFFYLGLSLDLLIFILFKYFHIINIDIMNWPNWSVQKLLIPIGISFYTFKTVGYCIDIYKRKYPPESSFVYYALSVSFFPQLIAGPIEKSVVISAQIKQNKAFNIQNVIEGSKLIVWGLFKKIVIADSIAQIINPVFNNIKLYNGLDLWITFIAFAYQVYVDFSGYSDIAIGSAKCFGVKLPANFNKPFFAKNVREFWIRWHVSFSKWLKEYIFDSLGGISKTNQLKTAFNIFLLFLLVGFWHGATINFIIYSQLAFAFMIIDIISKDIRKSFFNAINIKSKSFTLKLISYITMVLMIAFLSVYFKLASISDSTYVFKHLLPLQFNNFNMYKVEYILLYIIVFEFFQYFQITADGHCFQRVKSFYIRTIMYIIIIFSILLFSSRPDLTFQYFQF